MRFRASAVVAGSLLLASLPAHAVAPRNAKRIAADHLTALPGARVTKPLRTHVAIRWSPVASSEWNKLAALGTWRAAWDPATGVPRRIWGSGLSAPGANGSAAIAEAFARRVLADHLALLAPGATAADFELVSNHSDGSIRSIGFIQRAGGRLVVGGQISFRFKRDRLIAIASEALPNVTVTVPRAKLAGDAVHARAVPLLRAELDLPGAPASNAGDEVVLPLVADDAVLGYRVVRAVTIDGGGDGRYLAYADVASGEVVAVQQLNTYATATLLYNSVDRTPNRPRHNVPAPRVHVMVSGSAQTTTSTGGVSWAGDADQSIITATTGDLVKIVNRATDGTLAAVTLALPAGGEAVWDASGVVHDDAQVQTYLATNTVKNFIMAHIDASMPKLGEQIVANVNISQDCNAFFDGSTINFFQASTKCQNTGLLHDVVYHEFGHALHTAEIIAGVGKFDGAMSEGASDFLAALITQDSGMGRGFFYTDVPLRELNPTDMEWMWPVDIGEIHHQGMIYGGTFWDLRQNLIDELGVTEGEQVTRKIYLGTLRRASDIPTALIEALVEDDDDGNLANGTPHECAIRNAFGRHGLRTASGTILAPGTLDESARAKIVRIELSGLSNHCAVDDIETVTVDHVSYGAIPNGTLTATQIGTGAFWVQLPLEIDGTMRYRANVKFKDGTTLTLADNLADPYYQIYQGHTIPLYCTSFEDRDPFAEGWTTATLDGSASPWAWGTPAGGATDPAAAFSGNHVLAQAIGGNYAPSSSSYVRMPTIDFGRWSDVRLQYRRWLAVEDSHYDQARITVNDVRAWVNTTADNGDASATHHVDREWRFHDLQLSGWAPGNTMTVAWDLTTDEGLELGGWALDDVCIVANINSVCGDGIRSPTEFCDDGANNANDPDRCRTYCQRPRCGDFIVDSNEECDHGPTGDYECASNCMEMEIPGLGGCCSANRDVGGSFGLSALVGVLMCWRRRRRDGSPG
ncbi:MAG: M36 family metallopeptidase [Kofleriaceae bacterium]